MSALASLLAHTAARLPAQVALVHKAQSWSYAEMAAAVGAVTSALRDRNISEGDRVAIWLPKQVEMVVSLWACANLGAIFIPVNPALKPAQVAHILHDSGAKLLVTSRARANALEAANVWTSCAKPACILVEQDWEAMRAAAATPVPPQEETKLAAILYTSGSTGKPKGVMLSHRNLMLGADSVATYLKLTEQDKILCVLPFSFDAGLNQMISAFKVGATVVLLDHLFPRDIVTAMEKHGITGLGAVPPLWIQLADLDLSAAAKTLRFISNTGGRMPKPVLARLRQQCPKTDIYLMYGLTEAFRSTYLDPALVDAHPESVGTAIPHAVIRIVRPDGSETAASEKGELVHAGPLVAMGYWQDAVKTAERFRPAPPCFPEALIGTPAVYSGDTFVRDENGLHYFVGRDDEMIKTSGYRVSPTEVEEALYETGMIVEAVAVGIPDDMLGAAIAAAVVAKAGISDIEAGVTDKLRALLPAYMIPKYIRVWAQLPRSPNGKLDRVEIAKSLRATSGGKSA